MSQDSETIHVNETTIASHQLVVPGFPTERARSGAASVEFRSEPGDDSLAMGSVGALPKALEFFAVPGDPPIITEGTRLTHLHALCSSQPEAPATEVLHPIEIAQIARLRSKRGQVPEENPTVTVLRTWIDDLGGIKPVKIDA